MSEGTSNCHDMSKKNQVSSELVLACKRLIFQIKNETVMNPHATSAEQCDEKRSYYQTLVVHVLVLFGALFSHCLHSSGTIDV